MIYTAKYCSPVGNLFIAEHEGALVGLWIEGQKYFLGSVTEATQEKDTPVLVHTKAWLDRYFGGERPSISELSLRPEGSEFRKKVWQLLCEIPYGETTTYGKIAKEMATFMGKEKMSAQAVGGAVGHNPISIIIPCHRVIGTDGSLTGYAGGIETKVKLLKHEGVKLNFSNI